MAPGRTPEIPWAKDWESAVREATTRGVPILVFFLKDGQSESDAVRTDTLTDRRLVAYLEEVAVAAVAHTGDDGYVHSPEAVDDGAGGTSYRCPLYPPMECLQHIVMHSKMAQLFKADRFPGAYLLGPDGKRLPGRTEVDPLDPDGLVAALGRAQKELGKPMMRSIYARSEQALATGRAAFEAGETKESIQTLQALEKDKKAPEPFRTDATALLNEINQAGMAALREASKLLAEDREAGKKELRRIRSAYKGLEAGTKAKEALIEAGKRPKKGEKSEAAAPGRERTR